MDSQIVEDDCIYNTKHLTQQKHFDQSTNLKGLLPYTKSPRGWHKSLYYQNHFEVFQFPGRSLFQYRFQFTYAEPVITAFEMLAEEESTRYV